MGKRHQSFLPRLVAALIYIVFEIFVLAILGIILTGWKLILAIAVLLVMKVVGDVVIYDLEKRIIKMMEDKND